MKCKLCDKYFISETSFINLFSFVDLCNQCERTYNIEPTFEVIPIQNGLIYYYYLYDDLVVNRKQYIYLLRYFRKLFNVKDFKKATMVLIIDDFVYELLKQEAFIVLGKGIVLFMSLFRYDFDEIVNFS